MANSEVLDISDNSFRINKINVLSPLGGEILTSDHTGFRKYLLSWAAPNIDKVRVEYSPDNGNTWSWVDYSTPANPGNYVWTIPSAPTTNGLIRISNEDNGEIYCISNAPFTIRNPLRIMNANGGGFVTDTSLLNIRWHNQNINPNSTLYWEYSANNSTWTRINQNPVSVTDDYMEWFVTTGLHENMWLRAVESATGYILTASEAPFRVTDKILYLNTPTTGNILGIDSYTQITWHAVDCTDLIIEYTTDFGQSWLPIASGIPATQGSYLWQVPNTPSHECRIRLRDMTHSYMTIESEGEFSIVPFNFNAAFHADNTIGFADLVVQFYDDSIGYVSSWAWDFNSDGITDAYEQNPVWIFQQSGFYSVTLTIFDGETLSSVTRQNYIYVYPWKQTSVLTNSLVSCR
jgi:PKD repeat protein